MEADVKGDIYEGLLAKSAAESPKGAGQYFTPRELIKGIVDCVRPTPDDTLSDPACGTGGFLICSHEYVAKHHGKDLDPDQKKHLRKSFVHGWELVPNTARLCIMNLYLHGIDADPCPRRYCLKRPREGTAEPGTPARISPTTGSSSGPAAPRVPSPPACYPAARGRIIEAGLRSIGSGELEG